MIEYADGMKGVEFEDKLELSNIVEIPVVRIKEKFTTINKGKQ